MHALISACIDVSTFGATMAVLVLSFLPFEKGERAIH
jgi:hypothetical protein